MIIAGNKDEKIKKFCKFLSLKNEDQICPIARKILDEFVCNPQNLEGILAAARHVVTYSFFPEVSNRFLIKSDIGQLERLFFLFAAGTQLGTQTSDNPTISVDRIFINQHPNTRHYVAAYHPPHHPEVPNSIGIAMGRVINFCGNSFAAIEPGASKECRDALHAMVRDTIKAGAEEAYHAYQHMDPVKLAQLEPPC